MRSGVSFQSEAAVMHLWPTAKVLALQLYSSKTLTERRHRLLAIMLYKMMFGVYTNLILFQIVFSIWNGYIVTYVQIDKLICYTFKWCFFPSKIAMLSGFWKYPFRGGTMLEVKPGGADCCLKVQASFSSSKHRLSLD